jgi:hypothetical protein
MQYHLIHFPLDDMMTGERVDDRNSRKDYSITHATCSGNTNPLVVEILTGHLAGLRSGNCFYSRHWIM